MLETMKDVVVVLTTVPDEAAGRTIAQALVSECLAACVNQVPRITSFYRWEDRLCEDTGDLLIIKTVRERLSAVTDLIRSLHPDVLPEVIALPVSGGLPAYLAWVVDEVACPLQGGTIVER